jgi:tetratricopeptide (TPR) repeat protein
MYVDQNDVADLYRDRGSAYIDLKEPFRAFDSFEEALRIIEALHSEGALDDARDLVDCRLRSGDAYAEFRLFEEALVDYDRAIGLMGGPYSNDGLSDPMMLAYALEKRSDVREELEDFRGAKDDRDRAAEYAERALAMCRFGPDATRAKALRAARKESDEKTWRTERNLFLDRVRDSVLGRRAWRRLGADETRSLRLERNPVVLGSSVSSSRFEAIRYELPFYRGSSLLELAPEATSGSLWLLDRGGSLSILDGTSAPLYEAAAACPLELTRENAIEYIRFFTFFVRVDDSPLIIVDDLAHPLLNLSGLPIEEKAPLEKAVRPPRVVAESAPRVVAESAPGTYRVEACMVHGHVLFAATFDVGADGRIAVGDRTRIADRLSVNELRTLHD